MARLYFKYGAMGSSKTAPTLLGSNDSYIAMCHRCWVRGIREDKSIKLHK